MRSAALAVVALVAAVLGGATVLVVGSLSGWRDGGETTTVVAPPAAEVPAVDQPAALVPAPAPRRRAGFDPSRTYAERSAGVVTVYASFDSDGPVPDASQGSGFVVSPQGHVLTNAHVITREGGSDPEPAKKLYVQFEDGDQVGATIVGWDIFNDVGVLKVDPRAHPLQPVPLGDSSRVVVGEPVLAIGSPFGEHNTLTSGIISGVGRSIRSLARGYQIIDAIQTDAEINHGNSGGPLFNARGEAIGINAQIRSTNGLNQGVGFAVPINTAKRSLRQLVRTGRVAYAYVGVTTDDLTPTLAREFRYRARYGAVVECVTPGGPAAEAGLRAGSSAESRFGRDFVRGADVIVEIAGQPVRRGQDVARIVTGRLHPGQVVRFRVLRGSASRSIAVKLGERPADPSGCPR